VQDFVKSDTSLQLIIMWSHFPLEIWLLESIRLILLCFQVM